MDYQAKATTAAVATNDSITLKTPGGHEVVIKGFISGGDMEDLQRVFLDNMVFAVNPSTGLIDQSNQQIKGTVSLDRTKKAIELLVLSVDAATTNVYQAVRDLPVVDYDAVVAKVQEISAPLDKTPSTPSESNTTKSS